MLTPEEIEHFAHGLADPVQITDDGPTWRDAGYDSAGAAAAVLLGDCPSTDADITARAIEIVADRLIEQAAS